MRLHLLKPALVAAALTGLVACGADHTAAPIEDPSFARGGVPPTPGSATFEYHAGDVLLGSIDPAFAPAKAMAANGDVIELSATGTLSVFPKAVTGGGTFTHKDSDGNVLGSGTWAATELLSFQNYGPSPLAGFPPDFRAGNALIRVHLTATGGAAEFDGTFRITCILPGVPVPSGFAEGVRLAIDDVINFTREHGGATVFVASP